MLVSTTEDEERVKDHLEPQPYLSSSHQAEEEATMAALIQDLITSKARMEADRLLALRLQEEERERAEIERRRLRNEMKSCDPDKKEEGCQEEITALTDAVKAMLLQNKTLSPAPVKAIVETCVTCGGSHPYYECLATNGNTFNAFAATRTYNQGGQGYRPQGETNYHAINHMRPPGFPQPNV
ncbi:hypothetical protein Tco_1202790 [Tanacetum coccineum]